MELNPRSGHAYQALALVKLYQGRAEEALPLSKRSVELDPLAQLWNWGLATIHIAVGDREGAIDRIRTLLEIDPNFWMAYMLRGSLQLAQGKPGNAIHSFEEAVRLSGGAPYALGLRASALATAGQREAANRDLAVLLEAASKGYVPGVTVAFPYVG